MLNRIIKNIQKFPHWKRNEEKKRQKNHVPSMITKINV